MYGNFRNASYDIIIAYFVINICQKKYFYIKSLANIIMLSDYYKIKM
jgi:hypothetical protein